MKVLLATVLVLGLVLPSLGPIEQISFWAAIVAGQPEAEYFEPAYIVGQARLGADHLMPMAGKDSGENSGKNRGENSGKKSIGFLVFCSESQLPWLESVAVINGPAPVQTTNRT